MLNNLNNQILLIGSGQMAYEYTKVLESIQVEYIIIGRSKKRAGELSKKINKKVYAGGIQNFLNNNDNTYSRAIIAVGINELTNIARILMKSQLKNILIEKPGGLNITDILSLSKEAKKNHSQIYVAYNRRFYSSTLKAKEIIDKDGGLYSFKFDFTEWSSIVTKVHSSEKILKNWFLANSSHVIDLAFFLGGLPLKITSNNTGSLSWHPSGSIFTGSGITELEIPFSYHANWNSPGRWLLEFFTKNHRIIFCPLEELMIQNHKSLKLQKVVIDNYYDKNFKPGLYLQVSSFLNNKKDLLNIEDHASSMWYYSKINGNH